MYVDDWDLREQPLNLYGGSNLWILLRCNWEENKVNSALAAVQQWFLYSNKNDQDLWQAGSFTFTGPYLRAASNSSADLLSMDQFTFEVYLAMYLSIYRFKSLFIYLLS